MVNKFTQVNSLSKHLTLLRVVQQINNRLEILNPLRVQTWVLVAMQWHLLPLQAQAANGNSLQVHNHLGNQIQNVPANRQLCHRGEFNNNANKNPSKTLIHVVSLRITHGQIGILTHMHHRRLLRVILALLKAKGNLVWQIFARVKGNKVRPVQHRGNNQLGNLRRQVLTAKTVENDAGIVMIGIVKAFAIQLVTVVDYVTAGMMIMTANVNEVNDASDEDSSATLHGWQLYLQWLYLISSIPIFSSNSIRRN